MRFPPPSTADLKESIPITQPPDPNSRPARRWRLLALSLGHGIGDGYVNFIPPLWPAIRDTFGLTNTGIGQIATVFGLVTNFSQPLFGYFSDRLRLRRLVVLAILVTAGCFSAIGYPTTLGGLITLLLLGGLGVALYHPRAGALAAEASGSRRGLGMAIFGAGGAIGYAAGALVSVGLYGRAQSLRGLIWAAPIGAVVALLLWFIDPEGSAPESHEEPFSVLVHLFPFWRQLLPLFVVMTLRSASVTALVNFLPLLLANRGLPLMAGGRANFFFVAGGAIGGLVGGHLSDLWGRRGITVATLLASPPLLYWSLLTSGWAFLAVLFAAGFILRCAESTNIAHTQELIPAGSSTACSLGMGSAWGIAGLIALPVGRLSDLYGEQWALTLTLWIPAAAGLVALWIPRARRE
jgi:FSR family fosmidomycin resistance protein-like MFS transporter